MTNVGKWEKKTIIQKDHFTNSCVQRYFVTQSIWGKVKGKTLLLKLKMSPFQLILYRLIYIYIYKTYIFLYSVTVIAISTAACAKAITNISSLFKGAVK